MIQNIIVGIILIISLFYVGRFYYKRFFPKKTAPQVRCAQCEHGCALKEQNISAAKKNHTSTMVLIPRKRKHSQKNARQ